MRRGFTLVELVVALVLLEVVIAGIVGILVLSSRTLSRAEMLERAVAEAVRVADSLAAEGVSGDGTSGFPGGRVVWVRGADAGQAVVWALAAVGDTLLELPLEQAP